MYRRIALALTAVLALTTAARAEEPAPTATPHAMGKPTPGHMAGGHMSGGHMMGHPTPKPTHGAMTSSMHGDAMHGGSMAPHPSPSPT